MTTGTYIDNLLAEIDAIQPINGVSSVTAREPLLPIVGEGGSVETLMQLIRNGDNWHTNMLKLTAHWVGRKLLDVEMLAMAKSLTLPDYSVEQTIQEVQQMIDSARDKWSAHADASNAVARKPLISFALSDFLKMDIPPREMLLRPIIPAQGLAMLYAERGVGKTFVALSIALAVATGSAMLGNRWSADKPRRVLFVDGEMPAIMMQSRLAELFSSLDVKLEDDSYLRIITPDHQEFGIRDIATDEGKAAIEEHLAGVELLILDNLSALMRNGRENDADSWNPIQDWLLSLRRRGISVLIVHHAGKGGNQRGTSKKEDLLDTVVMLKKVETHDPSFGAQFEVNYEKTRGFFGSEAKPFCARLSINEKPPRWVVSDLEDPLVNAVKELSERFDEKGKKLSQREIAKELNTSPASVNRILKSLKDVPKEEVQEEIDF